MQGPTRRQPERDESRAGYLDEEVKDRIEPVREAPLDCDVSSTVDHDEKAEQRAELSEIAPRPVRPDPENRFFVGEAKQLERVSL